MNKYIKIAFISFFLISCQDYLDVNPDSSLDVEIDSEEKIAELLTGAYPKASYFPFLEARTDNVGERKNGVHSRINEAMYFWEDYDYEDLDTPLNYWNSCYSGIAQVNKALELLAEYPKNDRVKALYGEAFLLRAYLHFMLANIWSQPYGTVSANESLGVPYLESPEKNALPNYKRGTVKELYEKIERDLKLGVTLVNDKYYKNSKFHFNKLAAYAFASRFYLIKGDWDLVIEYSNYVLGANPKHVLRNWVDYGNEINNFSNLSQYYLDTNESANLLLSSTESRWKRNVGSNKYGSTYNIIDDIFKKLGIEGCRKSGNGHFYGKSAYLFVKSLGNINDGAFMSKFDELSISVNTSYKPKDIYVTNVLLSTDEVMLNRIEAYAMVKRFKDAELEMRSYLKQKFDKEIPCGSNVFSEISINKYKIYSPFYGLTVKQLAMINLLVDLRRKEFYHEGLRWFDIRRFYMPVKRETRYANYQPLRKDDPRKLIQIPVQAIERGMLPNPR